MNGKFTFKTLLDGSVDRTKVICTYCRHEVSYHWSTSSLEYQLSISPPFLPQLPLFLNNQTCCLNTFVTKAHYTISSCTRHKANRRQCSWKSVADIFYPKSGFGCAGGSSLSTWEVGRVGGLAASYTQTSTVSLDAQKLKCECELCSDWLWCARGYGGSSGQCSQNL